MDYRIKIEDIEKQPLIDNTIYGSINEDVEHEKESITMSRSMTSDSLQLQPVETLRIAK